MTERRAVPRVQPNEPLDAKIMENEPARILDISPRGAQVLVAHGLPPEGRCDLRIQFAEGEFAAWATVRRCSASSSTVDGNNEQVVLYRAGLEFDELDPQCLAWLSSNVLSPSQN
jgi:c-di-GMP-binding flagellar brake protein YcgR